MAASWERAGFRKGEMLCTAPPSGSNPIGAHAWRMGLRCVRCP